jgi:ribonucleoside-triphosphate reductase
MDMYVIKRDDSVVDFDQTKITTAITKANNSVEKRWKLKDPVISFISDYVTLEIKEAIENSDKEAIEVETIQDIVESALVKYGNYDIAKEYIIYRYKRSVARQQNTTDNDILKLLANKNKLMAEENANKDTTMASTQRDYIAGITSRDITRRILLPEYISKAHDEGILHFHK